MPGRGETAPNPGRLPPVGGASYPLTAPNGPEPDALNSRRRSTGSAGASSRTPSSRSSSERASKGGAAGRAGPRVERDGKATVPCPNCGTQYRVPAEKLDDSLKCGSCGRAFVPSAMSKRGLQRQNPAKPFIVGAAILVGAVVIGVLINSSMGGRSTPTPPAPIVAPPDTGMGNPRVRDVYEWVEALQKDNEFRLRQSSDWTELARFLGVAKDLAPADYPAAVLAELRTGTRSAFLRNAEISAASTKAEQATAASGWVGVDVTMRKPDELKRYQRESGEYRVNFRSSDGRFVVTGWETMYEPPLRASAAGKGERAVTHEIIGKAQDVQRTLDGKTVPVREAELKPLPHLEGTTPEQQAEIDTAVAQLVDLENNALANRAIDKLRRIGKPSVPRLLNQMYEIVSTTKLDSPDARQKLRRIEQALEQMTGNRFGFDPSEAVVGNAAREEYRLSALKQWYGYWADNHASKNWNMGIETEESLDRNPTPDPKDGEKKN